MSPLNVTCRHAPMVSHRDRDRLARRRRIGIPRSSATPLVSAAAGLFIGGARPASLSFVVRRSSMSAQSTHSTTAPTAPTAPRNVYSVRPVSSAESRRVLSARRRLVDHLQQHGRRLRAGARVDAVDPEEGYA